MRRAMCLACVALVSMIVAAQFSAPVSIAQEKDGAKKDVAKKDAGKKAGTFRRRLPNYYGQVGLSTKQKDDIYKIQETYHNQIEVLQKQISDLQAKRDAETKAILSEEQQGKVNELVAAAKARDAERSKKKKKTSK
ncbi:MAG: hypothetical protein O3A00_25905 [Planctomycetota bacterium]|nr:hypothetical protein [Planctomycetota bacterium]